MYTISKLDYRTRKYAIVVTKFISHLRGGLGGWGYASSKAIVPKIAHLICLYNFNEESYFNKF